MKINPMNYNLKPVRNMPRISRKEFGENLDEILEKVEKDSTAFVITDEGQRDLILCPARWFSYCFDENFGDMLICAIFGSITLQDHTFDVVCAFIRRHLPVIDLHTLEELERHITDLMEDQTSEHKAVTGKLILDDIRAQIGIFTMPTKETELVEVSFAVDAELYEKAKAIIEGLGMTMDEAVTLFFKAVIAYGKIPFDYE